MAPPVLYQDSPLYAAITRLTLFIQAINRLHPLDKKKPGLTDRERYAIKVNRITEHYIGLAHDKVIPKFDNKNMPSALSFVSLVIPLTGIGIGNTRFDKDMDVFFKFENRALRWLREICLSGSWVSKKKGAVDLETSKANLLKLLEKKKRKIEKYDFDGGFYEELKNRLAAITVIQTEAPVTTQEYFYTTLAKIFTEKNPKINLKIAHENYEDFFDLNITHISTFKIALAVLAFANFMVTKRTSETAPFFNPDNIVSLKLYPLSVSEEQARTLTDIDSWAFAEPFYDMLAKSVNRALSDTSYLDKQPIELQKRNARWLWREVHALLAKQASFKNSVSWLDTPIDKEKLKAELNEYIADLNDKLASQMRLPEPEFSLIMHEDTDAPWFIFRSLDVKRFLTELLSTATNQLRMIETAISTPPKTSEPVIENAELLVRSIIIRLGRLQSGETLTEKEQKSCLDLYEMLWTHITGLPFEQKEPILRSMQDPNSGLHLLLKSEIQVTFPELFAKKVKLVLDDRKFMRVVNELKSQSPAP